MSDEVNKYKVLIQHLDKLKNDIEKERELALVNIEDPKLKKYQDRAIMIVIECLGPDATPHVKEIRKAKRLKPKGHLEFSSISLLTILKRMRDIFFRESEFIEQRLHIRRQLMRRSPDLSTPPESIVRTKKLQISKRIFIVHGHDEAMKQHVARSLTQLKLDPVILHEQPNKGRTIIEKFEEEAADVGFAVVLLSPDDEGRKSGDEAFYPRARQNVVLELGFFYGRLGRGRVVALHNDIKGFELPSDISGVIYIPYDRRGAWRMALCKELKECGYEVSADDL